MMMARLLARLAGDTDMRPTFTETLRQRNSPSNSGMLAIAENTATM